MDGRQILDGMNDDVIFGIHNGQAPWQCDVSIGMLRVGPSLTSVAGDAEGLASLQLSCLENRFGYHGGAWSEKAFADHNKINLEPDVRFFSTLDMSVDVGGDSGEPVMSGRSVVVYNNDHEISDIKGERFIAWPNLNKNLTARILEELTARGAAEWNDPCEMRAGIYDLVAEREAGFSKDFSFGGEGAQASAICHNIISQCICCLFGHGWDADEARLVEPNAVAKAVKNDPFWLARVCFEAEIRQEWMLQPDTCSQTYGSIRDYRAACEDFFGGLQQLDRRQYLIVPFEDNAEARAKGARFDRVEKAWYVPPDRDINDFAKWDRPSDLSPEAEFADTMRHHGLLVEGDAIMDGQPHRVMLEGQRPGASPAGSYKGYLDGRPAGHFTNFRDGDGKAVKWVASGHRVDPALRSATAREIEAKREARKRELAAKQDAAARRAVNIWRNVVVPDDDLRSHQYLRDKRVRAYDGIGISRDGQTLYVPAYDIDDRLRSLQMIYRDRDDGCLKKRFLKDSLKEGCFCILERDRAFGRQPVLIAEGYATAASVLEATGRPVIVAFDAHNLKPVAEALRGEIRNQPFIFIADDDRKLAVNKGVECAAEAARAVGGSAVVVPAFDMEGLFNGLTDFNDLHQHAGIEVVGRQVNKAMSRILKHFRVRRIGTDEDSVIIHQSDEFAPALSPARERSLRNALGQEEVLGPEEARKGRSR